MNFGMIGLPQTGKKTLFQLLTERDALSAPKKSGIAYGMALVRDPRVDQLSAMYNPKKTKYAEFELALPPDVQPDTAHTAEWLPPLRNMDGLLHVVRAFQAPEVFHIHGDVNPARDVETVETELLLADLAMVETRITRIEKEPVKKGPEQEKELALLARCQEVLEHGNGLRTLELSDSEEAIIRSLQFLTRKPLVVVINTDEDLQAAEKEHAGLATRMKEQGAEVVFFCASIEQEVLGLDEADRADFMNEFGMSEPASTRVAKAMFSCLGLLSFFTVGPDEVKAWSVRNGATAPEAAGRIHSDLQRGFIRADTVHVDALLAAGSEKAAREANAYRLNGKDYIVQDGDILEIRFNV